MAATSNDLPLGSPMPEFDLPTVTGGRVAASALVGRPTLVLFVCRHCPYVKHLWPEVIRLAGAYADRVAFVGIASNDADAYPEDGPDSMAELMAQSGLSFPMAYDEAQDVARAFDAVCTPEFYVFDGQARLRYHGQLDDSRHKNDLPLTGRDLREALDAVLRGELPATPQKPAVGCSIKWKA